MSGEPDIVVPPEIRRMALAIDLWAKSNGFDTYCIGPVCSRDYADSCFASMAAYEAEQESNPPPMPPHMEP